MSEEKTQASRGDDGDGQTSPGRHFRPTRSRRLPGLVFPNSWARSTPIGEPSPVHGSGPGPALYMPLSPTVMSLKSLGFCHKRGRNKSQLGSERREQPGIERRHRAGSAHHGSGAMDVNVVPGVGVGISRPHPAPSALCPPWSRWAEAGAPICQDWGGKMVE